MPPRCFSPMVWMRSGWLRHIHWHRQGERHLRRGQFMVQHLGDLQRSKHCWRRLQGAVGERSRCAGKYHSVHSADGEAGPRDLHGEQRNAYQPRRLHLFHRQHCRARKLGHNLRHSGWSAARSESSQLVSECLRSCRAAIQFKFIKIAANGTVAWETDRTIPTRFQPAALAL
jgi:hypothetical protein